jgi:phosphatidylserine/phosphatidylglycerophosphate/cardiolipin synthase-like enzyme
MDPALTLAVQESFERDFRVSTEVSLEDWQRRPLWRRLQQRLWGWVDRLVVNALDRRG